MFDYEDDDKTDLSVIRELMEQLIGEMKPSEGDFAERLGRKKPEMEVLKVEAKPEMLSSHESMDEGCDDEEMSPGAKLKSRLMKLRA